MLVSACSAPEPPQQRIEAPSTTSAVQPPDSSDPLEPLMPLEDLPALTAEQKSEALISFPYLDGEPVGATVSIGDTTHGRLANGRELAESDALKILPRQKERDLKYGTDGLVGLLEYAGKALHDKTKTAMWVGNLGRREGGDIEWSVSHNAGRDADVAFCYRDPVTNKAVDPPDLVVLGKDGVSKDRKYAFDVARTWNVVRAMLEYEGASLQYLFISDPLRKKLLDYAKANKEPAYLIDHAAELLKQPGAAAAHDDHLHVRIHCSAMDAAGGCVDMGAFHTFSRRFLDQRDKAAERARKQAANPVAGSRRRALLRLGLVGTPADAPLGVSALADSSAEVRAAAAELVAALGTDKDSAALIARFREESDSAVLAALVEAVGFLGGAEAGPFFRDVLLATAGSPVMTFSERALPLDLATAPFFFGLANDPYPPMRSLLAPKPLVDLTFDRANLQRLAVKAVRHSQTLEAIEPLIGLLDPYDPQLASLAAESLSYLTNQRLLEAPSSSKSLPDRMLEARTKYLRLVATMAPARTSRDAWLIQGFSTRGYKVPAFDRRGVWELLRAVSDEPHLSFNARGVLARVLGLPREVLSYGPGDGCRQLYRILNERRSDLHLDRPTEAQRNACSAARSREKDTLAVAAAAD